MLKFKKNKLVECTEEEFETLARIVESSSCMSSAASRIRTLMLRGDLAWNEPKVYSTNYVSELAMNAAMAVKCKYKYLKVKKAMTIVLYYYLGYLLGNALIIGFWMIFRRVKRKRNDVS